MRKKQHKYRAVKTVIDGISFPSKKEAARYVELRLLQKAGKISRLELQPGFLLQEKFRHQGKAVRPINYIADFKYIDEKGKVIIEDVKGWKTDIYKLKKKLLLFRFPDINFYEI